MNTVKKFRLAALIIFAFSMPVFACDDRMGHRLTAQEPGFVDAMEVYTDETLPGFLRADALFRMLRVDDPLFSAVIRDAKLKEGSGSEDILSTAIFCEVMRANGFSISVDAIEGQDQQLSQKQMGYILAKSYPLKAIEPHFDSRCVSTNKSREPGCNSAYFVSAVGPEVHFRHDADTGVFRWADGKFEGTIRLKYGGPFYSVRGTLIIQ